MAAQTNLTVKKYDGTTDIVFSALSPSGGDGSPAVWRCESVGAAAGFRPVLKMTARFNGAKTARRVEYEMTYPETSTDSTTGITSVVNKAIGSGSFLLPENTPDAVKQEMVAQSINLLKALVTQIVSGYAPT